MHAVPWGHRTTAACRELRSRGERNRRHMRRCQDRPARHLGHWDDREDGQLDVRGEHHRVGERPSRRHQDRGVQVPGRWMDQLFEHD